MPCQCTEGKSEQGFSRVELRNEDVLCIIRTLEYDGLVDACTGDTKDVFKPARLAHLESTPFAAIPCGTCPVRTQYWLHLYIEMDQGLYFEGSWLDCHGTVPHVLIIKQQQCMSHAQRCNSYAQEMLVLPKAARSLVGGASCRGAGPIQFRSDWLSPQAGHPIAEYLGLSISCSLLKTCCMQVIGECKDGGVISPSTCIYFDQWLQF